MAVMPMTLSPPSINTLAGVKAGGRRLQAMHQQRLLPRASRRSLVIQHLEIIDPIERGISNDRGSAVFIAACVDHEGPP